MFELKNTKKKKKEPWFAPIMYSSEFNQRLLKSGDCGDNIGLYPVDEGWRSL